jgi:hypothetical protein
VALEDLALVRMAVSAPEVSGRIFGFHAQQCVEKLLKAVLASCGVDFPFTHDLEALRRLLVEQGLTVPVDPTALALLTPSQFASGTESSTTSRSTAPRF